MNRGQARSILPNCYLVVAHSAGQLYLRGGYDLLHCLALLNLEWPHIRSSQAWTDARHEADDQATHLCDRYPGACTYCASETGSPNWANSSFIRCTFPTNRTGPGALHQHRVRASVRLREAGMSSMEEIWH